MKLLTKIVSDWNAYNKANYNKKFPMESKTLEFIPYVKRELEKIKKIDNKVNFLKELLDDLRENLSKIEDEKQDFYTKFWGTRKTKVIERKNMPIEFIYKLSLKDYKIVERFYERITEVYSYINQIRNLLDDWKNIQISNSETNINKITWLKNKQDLVAVFDYLNELGYIAFKKNKDEILRKHFTWLDGDIGKNDLKSHRSNLRKTELYKQSDEVKIFIDKIKTPKAF